MHDRIRTVAALAAGVMVVGVLCPSTSVGETGFGQHMQWTAWYEAEGIQFIVRAQRAGNFRIPLGSVFVSDDPTRQALLIPDDAGAILEADETRDIYVSVFCLNENVDAPEEQASVRYYGNAGPDIRRILQRPDGWRHYAETQRLIWRHTAWNPIPPHVTSGPRSDPGPASAR